METVLQRRQTLLFAKMTHNRRQDCVDYAKDYECKGWTLLKDFHNKKENSKHIRWLLFSILRHKISISTRTRLSAYTSANLNIDGTCLYATVMCW